MIAFIVSFLSLCLLVLPPSKLSNAGIPFILLYIVSYIFLRKKSLPDWSLKLGPPRVFLNIVLWYVFSCGSFDFFFPAFRLTPNKEPSWNFKKISPG